MRAWHGLARTTLLALLMAGWGVQPLAAQELDGSALASPRGALDVVLEGVLEEVSEDAVPDGSALASPHAPRSLLGDFHLDLTVGTVFPVAVGGGLRLTHAPSGLFLDAWGGGTPSSYASLAGEGAGAYGVGAGPRGLLEGVLDGAGVLRLAVGVQPIADLGLELSVGYSLLVGAPSLARTTLEAATGQSFRPAGANVDVMLAVHALHVELGYTLVLFDHLLLRATVGSALAVGADFRVEVPADMRTPGGPVERVEQNIASSIPGRVFLPTLRVEAGARF